MKKLFLLNLFLLFISCSSDDDVASSNSFSGDWSGTYINDINSNPSSGTWSATVYADNTITGTYIEAGQLEFSASGTIDSNGNVSIGIYELGSNTQAGKFSGKFFENGNASGTWENLTNPNYHGTWQGSKL